MKSLKHTVAIFLLGAMLTGYAVSAMAGDGNPKRGRVYFKMVCTVCHMTQTGRAIPPATYSMGEWKQYLASDNHDGSSSSNASVRYYLSREYRSSVQDSNKAAKKFLKMPADKLYDDVHTFLISGAKDSDTPASCE
jgi:hypothetical protein